MILMTESCEQAHLHHHVIVAFGCCCRLSDSEGSSQTADPGLDDAVGKPI